MMNSLPPGIIILVGALALPLLPRATRCRGTGITDYQPAHLIF